MTTKHRTIPELSIETQTLERVLLAVAVGATVSYEQLSAAIGRDVQNGAVHLLQSARRRAQREHQMIFEPVRGKGLKRLDDVAIAGSGDAVLDRVRNAARRGQQKLTCVQDFEALPNDAKIKHNVALSVLGAIGHVSKTSSIKKLEGTVTNGRHDALPVAKFLDAVRQGL